MFDVATFFEINSHPCLQVLPFLFLACIGPRNIHVFSLQSSISRFSESRNFDIFLPSHEDENLRVTILRARDSVRCFAIQNGDITSVVTIATIDNGCNPFTLQVKLDAVLAGSCPYQTWHYKQKHTPYFVTSQGPRFSYPPNWAFMVGVSEALASPVSWPWTFSASSSYKWLLLDVKILENNWKYMKCCGTLAFTANSVDVDKCYTIIGINSYILILWYIMLHC